MKIVIAGAGVIGSNLARSLAEENHKVYVIEDDEEIARRVDEKIDVKVIDGSASDPDTLKKVVDEETDLVIAVTTSDETNLVVCSLATAFGAKRRIARVRHTSLSRILGEYGYRHFNIDEIINPELVAALDIVKTIETPGAFEVADFADGRIFLRAFEVPGDSPLCGVRIAELNDDDFPWPFLIIAIVRDDNVIIPAGETTVEQSDRIYVLLPAPSLGEFLTFVDPAIKKPKKVIVYGATNTGQQVVQKLSAEVKDVMLIEEDAERAEEVAGILEGTTVIHGSAAEADILTECGVEVADAFVAVSNNDHSNLVSAVLAKKMGAKSTTITTQQPDYVTIIDALNIDVVINPRFLAVDQILRIVRGRGISHVTTLPECGAETVEFITEEGAPIAKAPIKDVRLPKNSIVGAVWRGDEVFLAKGDTQIKAGDKAIVFCQETAIKKLQKLFTKKKIL